MKKAREFDNILDECLERVLTKGETIDQCLSWYPEYAVELEPLLRTALATKEATAIRPRPEFRERASYQFRSALREMESKKGRGFFIWQPRWATAVIVVIVLLLAGSGTVAAAGNSMPDEPLYQVKLATEAVQLALTPSDLGKAELHVKLADKRVDEIIKMADKGKAEQVEKTAERLNTQLMAVAELAVPGGEEIVETGAATFETAQPEMAVKEASPEPAIEAVEVPEPSIAISPPSESLQQVPEPAPTLAPAPVPAPAPPSASLEQVPEPAPAPVPAPTRGKAPAKVAPRGPELPEDTEPEGIRAEEDEGIESDKLARLKTLVEHRAIENREALEQRLEGVPESVKPALRRALEQATAGYEEALKNLD